MQQEGTTPITIVVDTREQEPYTFPLPSVRRALPAGDYSLAGLELSVAVERKALDDFVSTITRGRSRFKRELEKLKRYRAACIVVEGSLSDVLRGIYVSQTSPSAVLGTAISLCVDWGIPVYWCGDRQCARLFTEAYLRRCARRFERDLE